MSADRKIVATSTHYEADESEPYCFIKVTIGKFPNEILIEIPHYIDCKSNCACLDDIVRPVGPYKYAISAEMVDNINDYDPALLLLTNNEYNTLCELSRVFRAAIVNKKTKEFTDYCDKLW